MSQLIDAKGKGAITTNISQHETSSESVKGGATIPNVEAGEGAIDPTKIPEYMYITHVVTNLTVT